MKKSDFSPRFATPEDLQKIVDIEDRVQVSPWSQEQLESELTKPYSHILLLTDDETDNVVVGYIVFWMLFDECQILNLAVDEPYQRQGVAQDLIRKVFALCNKKGIQKIVLEVRKSNTPAIQLYQKANFVITHIRKGFYSNGEDAYFMSLSLVQEMIEF